MFATSPEINALSKPLKDMLTVFYMQGKKDI
jgi:hypothetical protein